MTRTDSDLRAPAPLDPDTELEVLVRARYPILYVVSWEEERVETALAAIADKRGKRLVCWSVVRGLHLPGESLGSARRAYPGTTTDVMAALDEVVRQVEPTIFLFKDLHPFLAEPTVVRKLREMASWLKTSPKTLVLVSPSQRIPTELEKDVTVIQYGLPRLEHLGRLLDSILDEVAEQPHIRIDVPPPVRERLLQAAMGLTLKEAENAFARTIVQRGCLSEEEVGSILDEKRQIIQKSGILEYFDSHEGLGDVGGLHTLKDWIRKRTLAFTDEARRYGLPPPKGILLIGVQGCGKSLCARAISQVFGLPLLRLDMGRIFSSFMGSSEENARKAIATAESLAPSILWIDEIEKALAGGRSSGETDAGTTSRIFGTFLSWLQEKTAPVFVVATANDIRSLPPELLRKGRFDEIFFVDLPIHDERRDIFEIHLRRRKRRVESFDVDRLAGLTEGYSGSEIEQAIIAGMYESFALKRELTTQDIASAALASVPLSRTMREELDALRAWAEHRARPAALRAPRPAGGS